MESKVLNNHERQALENIALQACILNGWKEQKKIFALCVPSLEMDSKGIDSILLEVFRRSLEDQNLEIIKSLDDVLTVKLNRSKVTQIISRMMIINDLSMSSSQNVDNWIDLVERRWGLDYQQNIQMSGHGGYEHIGSFLEFCAQKNGNLMHTQYGWNKKSAVNTFLKKGMNAPVWQQTDNHTRHSVMVHLCMELYKGLYGYQKNPLQKIQKMNAPVAEILDILERISEGLELDYKCIVSHSLVRNSDRYEPIKRSALDFLPAIYVAFGTLLNEKENKRLEKPLWKSVAQEMQKASESQVLGWIKLVQKSALLEASHDKVTAMLSIVRLADPEQVHRKSTSFWEQWISSDTMQGQMNLDEKTSDMAQIQTDPKPAGQNQKMYNIQVPHWSLGYKCLQKTLEQNTLFVAPKDMDLMWLPMVIRKHVSAMQEAGKSSPKLLNYHVLGNTLEHAAHKEHKMLQLVWLRDHLQKWVWMNKGKQIDSTVTDKQQRWNQELRSVLQLCDQSIELMQQRSTERKEQSEGVYNRFVEQVDLLCSIMGSELQHSQQPSNTKKRILKA